MDKVKEIKVKDNGEQKKLSRAEMIKQLEGELKQLEVAYHQKSGYLACLKEID